ncbi:agmatinase [Candidatus Desantisbacteria bacterium CG_4_10_14_0_8_um_filter_48_22]|uniref:Agmatinase n=1 Tax=Candidatus Desantisbacteria bacterium CG_4_10_14_0_8_um_filter_48_22 TaxID=1974543 RepID=A0A2M7S4X6_9BACT|nr:MAG: agmatinase [Candidatus Desantisbacteria bacterium CG1_02_49_89]PIV55843.1 MAG: agmatinase [Candidatus Desantisbacteria bacterium CG02_land_8_20_14_3_00_49_13]PIZ14479.1 MAG: agmatinase [Candidatus Desantisbacteria bacterium CG_4_10_14_0_8_um_filter_48_22]
MKKITIFGCPFDRTSSCKKGSRFAPREIRRIMNDVEDYSPYFDRDLRDIKFRDDGDLDISRMPMEKALQVIESKARDILKEGGLPFALGGEHTVSVGAVRALKSRHADLKVICLDAHCDLKDSYYGQKMCHATASRRMMDLVGERSLFIFGARSGVREEFEFARKRKMAFDFSAALLGKVVRSVSGSPVYISVDLDVFDPGVFPGTGVAEPGGIGLPDFIKALKLFSDLNIAGMDAVELSPPCDPSEASTFLAATAVREMLLMAGS